MAAMAQHAAVARVSQSLAPGSGNMRGRKGSLSPATPRHACVPLCSGLSRLNRGI